MSPKKYNVLVTAVGGDIGQAIARVLRRLNIVARIVGTDMSDDHPGGFVTDVWYQVPSASSTNFLPKLEELIRKERIDFLIPVSELEIGVVHAAASSGWKPTILVMPDGQALPTCLDKFDTVSFLKKHDIATPWTKLASKGPPLEVPCILKERQSWGSKSLVQIPDMDAANFWAKRRPTAIFQELLLPENEEYTCGIFRSKSRATSTVVFRRTLEGAQTAKAIVVQDEAIEELCRRVADVLELRGAINIQLRKTTRGPIPFEINPRFSSTVIFRELIGFRDVLWSLLDLLGEEVKPIFFPPVGTKIYRVFTEQILNP